MSSSSTLNSALKNLPPESALLRIGTSSSSEAHAVALFQVGPILGKIPVLREQVLLSERLQSSDVSKPWETIQEGELELLTIPCRDADEPERITIVRQWLEEHSPTATLVAFRNAAVVWSPGRVAISCRWLAALRSSSVLSKAPCGPSNVIWKRNGPASNRTPAWPLLTAKKPSPSGPC